VVAALLGACGSNNQDDDCKRQTIAMKKTTFSVVSLAACIITVPVNAEVAVNNNSEAQQKPDFPF
jgi:hypothetical protein